MDDGHIEYHGINQEERMTMSNVELLLLTLISDGIEIGNGARCITDKRLDAISLLDSDFFDFSAMMEY